MIMTYSQHRANLKTVCSNLATAQDAEVTENESVNKKLEKFYAQGDESVLFITFEEWANLGYRILKGSKAFEFWGAPEEFEIRDKKNPSKIESIGSYCPIIFKFSEHQVERPENLR